MITMIYIASDQVSMVYIAYLVSDQFNSGSIMIYYLCS